MKRFSVSSALKSSNAVKIKGFAVIEIFQYLFMLVFAHRSIYMDMKKETVTVAKDTVYRFLNSARINWLKFTMFRILIILMILFIQVKLKLKDVDILLGIGRKSHIK